MYLYSSGILQSLAIKDHSPSWVRKPTGAAGPRIPAPWPGAKRARGGRPEILAYPPGNGSHGNLSGQHGRPGNEGDELRL